MQKRRTAAALLVMAIAAVSIAVPATGDEGLTLSEKSFTKAIRSLGDVADQIEKVSVESLNTPKTADGGVGPGTQILIERDDRVFICTANYVWRSPTATYLGAAGHCFLPEGRVATHGPGADFDASEVVVSACIQGCYFGGQASVLNDGILGGEINPLGGKYVELGRVAYARQRLGDEELGFDFGIVEIPSGLIEHIRLTMPVFGGPTKVEDVRGGQPVCQYGSGVVVGETFPTMGRVGIGGGVDAGLFLIDSASAHGDSGSAVQTCELDGAGFRGRGAAGVLTHLVVWVPDPKIKFRKMSMSVMHGVVAGTTMAQAARMATEAGIQIKPWLSQGG